MLPLIDPVAEMHNVVVNSAMIISVYVSTDVFRHSCLTGINVRISGKSGASGPPNVLNDPRTQLRNDWFIYMVSHEIVQVIVAPDTWFRISSCSHGPTIHKIVLELGFCMYLTN